jgi:hypothetical protein
VRGRGRLGQDSLPNIAISIAETSGNYIRCFTRTRKCATISFNDSNKQSKVISHIVICCWLTTLNQNCKHLQAECLQENAN